MALFRLLCLIAALLCPFAGVTEEQATASWPAELPQQPVEVRDAALLQVIDATAKLEVLSSGHQWAEGPVAEPGSGAVLFSDVPKTKSGAGPKPPDHNCICHLPVLPAFSHLRCSKAATG